VEKKSKIYVAGHRGMVGSALMRGLSAAGYENIVVRQHAELDLARQTDVEDFFEKEKPDYVFLAAAKVGGILSNNTYKADFIYKNIMIAANVIYASYRHGVKKLLNLGSSCIYPKFAPQPMKEEFLLTGALEPTNEPYAIAKISALKMCRYFNEQFKTNFISAMPTNLYGPNDNYNLETSHVLPAFIRKFHLAKLFMNKQFDAIRRDVERYPLGFHFDNEGDRGDEQSIRTVLKHVGIEEDRVTIWGAGEVRREFLYADDLADACIFLMQNCNHDELGEFINIGTGEDITLIDVAKIIKEIVGFQGHIQYDRSRPEGTPRKLLDVSRINGMGWKAKIALREGIRHAYDWYCGNDPVHKSERKRTGG